MLLWKCTTPHSRTIVGALWIRQTGDSRWWRSPSWQLHLQGLREHYWASQGPSFRSVSDGHKTIRHFLRDSLLLDKLRRHQFWNRALIHYSMQTGFHGALFRICLNSVLLPQRLLQRRLRHPIYHLRREDRGPFWPSLRIPTPNDRTKAPVRHSIGLIQGCNRKPFYESCSLDSLLFLHILFLLSCLLFGFSDLLFFFLPRIFHHLWWFWRLCDLHGCRWRLWWFSEIDLAAFYTSWTSESLFMLVNPPFKKRHPTIPRSFPGAVHDHMIFFVGFFITCKRTLIFFFIFALLVSNHRDGIFFLCLLLISLLLLTGDPDITAVSAAFLQNLSFLSTVLTAAVLLGILLPTAGIMTGLLAVRKYYVEFTIFPSAFFFSSPADKDLLLEINVRFAILRVN